jgi:hypothetical protein
MLFSEEGSNFGKKRGGRSYSWVKTQLQSAGLMTRDKQKSAHRKKRERRPLPGMLIHQDGSRHEWLERQWHDPIVTLDDATGEHDDLRLVEEEGRAFVPWIGGDTLADILCKQYERTVSADNDVRFEGWVLQIPADRHRCHDVKAKVQAHRYLDGRLAIFHGPNREDDKRTPLLAKAA